MSRCQALIRSRYTQASKVGGSWLQHGLITLFLNPILKTVRVSGIPSIDILERTGLKSGKIKRKIKEENKCENWKVKYIMTVEMLSGGRSNCLFSLIDTQLLLCSVTIYRFNSLDCPREKWQKYGSFF